MLQVGQVALHGSAVFHAHGQRDRALAGELGLDLGRRAGDGEFLGPVGGEPLHHVDQLLGVLLGAVVFEPRRHVDRHERRVEAAGDGARIVEVAVLGALGDVFHLLEQPVGHVDVGVDDDELVGQTLGAGLDVLGRRRGRGRLRRRAGAVLLAGGEQEHGSEYEERESLRQVFHGGESLAEVCPFPMLG